MRLLIRSVHDPPARTPHPNIPYDTARYRRRLRHHGGERGGRGPGPAPVFFLMGLRYRLACLSHSALGFTCAMELYLTVTKYRTVSRRVFFSVHSSSYRYPEVGRSNFVCMIIAFECTCCYRRCSSTCTSTSISLPGFTWPRKSYPC